MAKVMVPAIFVIWSCLLQEGRGVVSRRKKIPQDINSLGVGNSTVRLDSIHRFGWDESFKAETNRLRNQDPVITEEQLLGDGTTKPPLEASSPDRFKPSKSAAQKGQLVVVFFVCIAIFGSAFVLWFFNAALLERRLAGHALAPYVKILTCCWCWTCSSIGLQMLNKTLVSNLRVPAFIAVFQMVFAVACLLGTSFHQFRQTTTRQLLIWLIVPTFFAGVLISSFYTFSYITLSLITVVRNLTPLFVLPIELYVMPADKRPKVTIWSIFGILVMVGGAIMYAASIRGNGLSGLGILFAIVNLVIAATDRLIQRRLLTTECKGLPSSICTIMNNLFGSLPTIAIACGTREFTAWHNVPRDSPWLDFRMYLLLVLSGFVGIGIGYFGFECQRIISATSFFVMQNFSKIGTIIVGILIFHDPFRGALCVFGLVLSILGSIIYGGVQLKIAQADAEKAKKQSDATPIENKVPTPAVEGK